MRMATFKVLKWKRPEGLETAEPVLDMPFDCDCGKEAFIPRVGREPMIICIKGHKRSLNKLIKSFSYVHRKTSRLTLNSITSFTNKSESMN